MTKINFPRYSMAVISFGILFFCFCSKLGESTDLGSGVINTVDPGKTDINRYFHAFQLDSSFIQERFSLPFMEDTGFGVHSIANGGKFFLGTANNEYSAGFFEIVIVRDTSAAKTAFIPGDTLKSLQFIFTRDSVATAGKFDLYAVNNKKDVFSPEISKKLATLSFEAAGPASKADTVNIVDSVNTSVYNRRYGDSIFKACSTWTKDSTKLMDTLRFAVVRSNDVLDSLTAGCTMVLNARRLRDIAHPADTFPKTKTFASLQPWYFVVEKGDRDTLKNLPISSFLSKRTAVFKYSIDSLWRSIGGERVMITAGFLISNPTTDDSLLVQCILKPDVLHDGIVLDSLFSVDGSAFSVKQNAIVFASYFTTLQKMYDDGSRPSSVYLYMRYINRKNTFKTVSLNIKPYFKAMITTP